MDLGSHPMDSWNPHWFPISQDEDGHSTNQLSACCWSSLFLQKESKQDCIPGQVREVIFTIQDSNDAD